FSFTNDLAGGDLKGNITINTKNLNYRLATEVNKFDLNFINQYLKELSNYGKFRATLDANVKASGNFKDAQNLNASGRVEINELHFGKDTIEDYASFEKLVVGINQLSPKDHKYLFDSILLMHPYFKFEQYDNLDNIQTMFGKKGAKASAVNSNPEKFNLVLEIGKYIRLLSKNFFSSQYQVKRLAITDGETKYNNFALNEKFSMAAASLSVLADSIDKNHSRVKVYLKTSIKPYGYASVSLSINPKDSSDFDMSYHFQKIPLAMFNAYLITYTSFPLDRGSLELKGTWSVRNGFIQSTNHLLIIDPRVTKRIRKKDSKWIPVPLIMAFVRERGNVIDYEIPITGNLKNPKFNLCDVIVDVLKNIFIKPPTTPYRLEVKNVENKVEKLLSVNWGMRQYSLSGKQEEFVQKIADFLKENPASSISIHPVIYAEKEKEYILFFEAKKKYFLFLNHKTKQTFSSDDSLATDKMSIKDSSFVRYLTRYCGDSMLFTIQQKCFRFIGSSLVNTKYKQLQEMRLHSLQFYFKQNNTGSHVKIYPMQSSIPYNGFSFFKIKYKGEIPAAL
ncbi:MAG: DUF748 domain-containing protein, partial [Bacteroidia bacterium]|nr:DUF748 domain-containing protein [Bacteroidia bacterium]